MTDKTLYLTLKRQWFDEILAGTKKVEYRDYKPFWKTRLGPLLKYNRYKYIEFWNGYNPDKCPTMRVEFTGITLNEKTGQYELTLGKIIAVDNLIPYQCELLKDNPDTVKA